jgi:transposase
MAHYRQSKRRTVLFLESILNQPGSAGWLVKLQNRTTQALRETYEQLVAALPAEPVLGVDETATKEVNQNAWLWTFVARNFTVFSVRSTREGTILRERLGAGFAGVVTCDRARMYFQMLRVQWCWAHLKRDFQAWIDGPDGEARRHGQDLMEQTHRLFNLWKQYRRNELSRAELKMRMEPVKKEIEALLRWGLHSRNARLRPTCRQLWKHRERLWVYLDVEGVEPTNNHSERALRHAVIWRKLSFGTQSESGSRFVETMLSVIETCRQQGRNLLEYVTNAIRAHLARQPVPSLLPQA